MFWRLNRLEARDSPTPKPEPAPKNREHDLRHMKILLTILLSFIALTTLLVALSQPKHTIRPEPKDLIPFKITKTYPHDANAYTEGLIYQNGFLFESIGLPKRSELRKIKLTSAAVVSRVKLADPLFAEGLTHLNEYFYQLTWKDHLMRVYNQDLKPVKQIKYPGEGWGITTDGRALIASDGSSQLAWHEPDTFAPKKEITVRYRNQPIENLNELEWVQGHIWANIWQRDLIAIINPTSGAVEKWLNLSSLRRLENAQAEVLNGIAYDTYSKRIFVTGKFWSHVYEVKITHQARHVISSPYGLRAAHPCRPACKPLQSQP